VHIYNVCVICLLNSHIYNQQQSLRKMQLSPLIWLFFLYNNFFYKINYSIRAKHGFVSSMLAKSDSVGGVINNCLWREVNGR